MMCPSTKAFAHTTQFDRCRHSSRTRLRFSCDALHMSRQPTDHRKLKQIVEMWDDDEEKWVVVRVLDVIHGEVQVCPENEAVRDSLRPPLLHRTL